MSIARKILFVKTVFFNVNLGFVVYHRNKGCIICHILNASFGEVYHNPFFYIKIVYFGAFRFDWYMYKKRRKKFTFYFFVRLRGWERGGAEADMSAIKSIFLLAPFLQLFETATGHFVDDQFSEIFIQKPFLFVFPTRTWNIVHIIIRNVPYTIGPYGPAWGRWQTHTHVHGHNNQYLEYGNMLN